MQQYEADIRQHISIEQQLKIYIDNLKYKMECDEKEAVNKEQLLQEHIHQLQKDKSRLDDLINIKDRELDNIRIEVKQLADQVKTSEAKHEKLKKESLIQAEKKYKGHLSQLQEELDKYKSAYQTQHYNRHHTNNNNNASTAHLSSSQIDTINGVVPVGQSQQYQTNTGGVGVGGGNGVGVGGLVVGGTFDNAALFGTGPSQMQLGSFYPHDDPHLLMMNIENSTKQSTLASGHKKNQLSL